MDFRCKGCYAPFDSAFRLPKLIGKCGHTLCAQCLSQLLRAAPRCPFDGGALSADRRAGDFPTNSAVRVGGALSLPPTTRAGPLRARPTFAAKKASLGASAAPRRVLGAAKRSRSASATESSERRGDERHWPALFRKLLGSAETACQSPETSARRPLTNRQIFLQRIARRA